MATFNDRDLVIRFRKDNWLNVGDDNVIAFKDLLRAALDGLKANCLESLELRIRQAEVLRLFTNKPYLELVGVQLGVYIDYPQPGSGNDYLGNVEEVPR